MLFSMDCHISYRYPATVYVFCSHGFACGFLASTSAPLQTWYGNGGCVNIDRSSSVPDALHDRHASEIRWARRTAGGSSIIYNIDGATYRSNLRGLKGAVRIERQVWQHRQDAQMR